MTNYRDQWAENESGEKFFFSVELQRRLEQEGLPVEPASVGELKQRFAPPAAPTREERRERKDERREQRQYNESFERSEEIEIDEVTGKVIGQLIMFNDRKGFGFIARGLDKIYFHAKKAIDDPKYWPEGQKVLYTVNEYRGKEEAIDVEEYEEGLE